MNNDPLLATPCACGSLALVRVTGDLDCFSSAGLDAYTATLMRDGRCHLVLELSGVGFCDSAGLNALVRLWHRTREANGSLTLAAVTAPVLHVIEITSLHELLTVVPTTSHALAEHAFTQEQCQVELPGLHTEHDAPPGENHGEAPALS
ncbi:STAS domain-containing protein [Streptomyces sp. NPDC053069]|uniref:STAS domain-containing protein n=1 Tax=Streptomyces sp. NPDC053069 TaxID=3365695 RepID=UPI0037D082E7